MKTTPLILAAGESSRMGTPKALLDFDGTSCLELILRSCARSKAASPLVVLGFAAAEVRSILPAGIRSVENPDFLLGQTSSLQLGLRRLPADSGNFLLFPIDFPLVRRETIDILLATPGEIVIPTHGGKRGHPARFGGSLVAEFLRLRPDEPAHQVVRRDPSRVVEIPVEDSEVVQRMNRPEEYRACLERFRSLRPDPPGKD